MRKRRYEMTERVTVVDHKERDRNKREMHTDTDAFESRYLQ